jgi:hypothetical protein
MFSKILDKTKTVASSIKQPAYKGVKYDIIGDVHGYASELVALLKKMDYHEINDVWVHDNRKAIFVGDFTCRGPETRRTVNIVRKMVENETGFAVLGNHELNAIAHFTKDREGRPFKQATGSNKRVMEQIKSEYLYEKDQLKDDLKWLRELPFFLDAGDFRVVHAYWSDTNLNLLKESSPKGNLSKKILSEMFSQGTELAKAMRQTTRGIEFNLPNDLIIKDSRNIRRTNFRVLWWKDPKGKTFEQISYGNKFILPEYTIPPELLFTFDIYQAKNPIVFLGHYCIPEDRMIPSPNICCVDNCVANGGQLAAYRWDGESKLKANNFVFQRRLGGI